MHIHIWEFAGTAFTISFKSAVFTAPTPKTTRTPCRSREVSEFRSREVRRCLHKALKDGMRHKQPVRRAQATPDMPSMTDNKCKHSHRDDVSMALPGSKLSKLFKLCPPRFIPKSRNAPQIRQRQQTVCLDKQTSVARKGHVASQADIWGDKETPPAAWHGRNVGGGGRVSTSLWVGEMCMDLLELLRVLVSWGRIWHDRRASGESMVYA